MLYDSNGQPAHNNSAPLDASVTPPLDDWFSPENLRLSQDFTANVGVKKLITTVPTRRPHRQEFVRVHPDPAYRMETKALELKDDRELYLVDPSLWGELPQDLAPRLLVTTISRQGVVFIWPLRLPGDDGRLDAFGRSALEAAGFATQRWVKIVANMKLGAYEVYTAEGALPDPEWPTLTFTKLLQIAFKDRSIRDVDHPVLQRLRGEV